MEYSIRERREINSLKLSEVELYENGKRIEIPASEIEEFELTGLAVRDFFEWRLREQDYGEGTTP